MSVNPGEHFACRKCGLKSYCTMFLFCESCGHQDADDRQFMVKRGGWTPKPCKCCHGEDSNRPQGVDEP